MTATGLTAHDLMQHGLMIDSGPSRIGIELRFERPAFVYGHRLKGCSIGAFTYFNAAGTSSAYRCNIGRYAQIGESSILGPPEHPMDWFSSHPFTFTRPKYMPNMYRFEDFARLAPDAQEGPSYADSMPIETTIGHEAYVGVSSFIKRGVRIGHGAVVGAKSIVTRDVPDYAIVVGSPAKVVRMRFAEPIVERFLNRSGGCTISRRTRTASISRRPKPRSPTSRNSSPKAISNGWFRPPVRSVRGQAATISKPCPPRCTDAAHRSPTLPAMSAAHDTYVKQLIVLLEDFTQDWDHEFEGRMNADTRLLGDLGFESIDIIQLVVAIEEDISKKKVPFDKLLMKDGRYVDDLSIGQIADFLVGFV